MEHLSNLRHAQILRSSSAPYRATFAPNLEQPSSSASNTQKQHVKSQATALITSHLKQELATILSASPLSKCLKDQAFAAVIRHAIAQTQETVAHVRTLPPPAVTAEIIDAIVLKATQETTEYANSMAAAAHEVPVEKFRIHLNPRTFQPLKRDVRDRDRGQFFSVLNGLLANYIKRECQLEDHRAHRAHKNNGLGGGGRPVSDSRKKRFRRGKRAQQLSDLVTRAVRDDSLTDHFKNDQCTATIRGQCVGAFRGTVCTRRGCIAEKSNAFLVETPYFQLAIRSHVDVCMARTFPNTLRSASCGPNAYVRVEGFQFCRSWDGNVHVGDGARVLRSRCDQCLASQRSTCGMGKQQSCIGTRHVQHMEPWSQ
jgi:hypothetical protein